MKTYRKMLWVLIIVLVLSLGSYLLAVFTELGYLESYRIVFGSVYVLFLPGFVLSYVFFPKTKRMEAEDPEGKAIDWIERIALSFALSIAVVPLAVFYLNLVGVKINLVNSTLTVLGIVVISGLILIFRKR